MPQGEDLVTGTLDSIKFLMKVVLGSSEASHRMPSNAPPELVCLAIRPANLDIFFALLAARDWSW